MELQGRLAQVFPSLLIAAAPELCELRLVAPSFRVLLQVLIDLGQGGALTTGPCGLECLTFLVFFKSWPLEALDTLGRSGGSGPEMPEAGRKVPDLLEICGGPWRVLEAPGGPGGAGAWRRPLEAPGGFWRPGGKVGGLCHEFRV